MNALALVLLAAVVSPDEQSYGPYLRPSSGAIHSIASANGHSLLAWSEVDPVTGQAGIRIGVLDSRARLVSAITEFAVADPAADAFAPWVATDGKAFFVVWIERGQSQRTVGVIVDRTGRPSGTPRPYGPEVSRSRPYLNKVVWDGTSYQLWGTGFAVHVTSDGTTVPNSHPGPIPSAVGADDTFAWLTTKVMPIYKNICSVGLCAVKIGDTYDLVWNAGPDNGTLNVGNKPFLGTMMAPAGNRFAIAYAVPLAVGYVVTGGGSASVWAELAGDGAGPGLACDDTDCVIAYVTAKGDVQGITFPIAVPSRSSLFTIAASERDERWPQVHLVSKGLFLVTYRSDQVEARLAGRMVTLGTGPTRRRAVR